MKSVLWFICGLLTLGASSLRAQGEVGEPDARWFHLALSSPLTEDQWSGHGGLIHEVVLETHLRDHPNPKAVEYYLCGPPMMVKACVKMLADLGVPVSQIAYDEF